MTRRVGRGIFAVGLVVALGSALASATGCSSQQTSAERTGSSGVADPANGCVLAGDASAGGYPTMADLPAGACDETARPCESLVALPCTSCDASSLSLRACTCASGTWSCSSADD